MLSLTAHSSKSSIQMLILHILLHDAQALVQREIHSILEEPGDDQP
jgi:hypothetical protein